MRKPDSMPLRSVPLLSLALFSLAACGRDDGVRRAAISSANAPHTDSGMSVSLASPAVSGGRGDGSPATATDAIAESAVADQAISTAAAPAMRAKSSFAAAGAAGHADISRGMPLPSIDVTGAMLVRHGQASIQVSKVDDALHSVRQVAAQFGGFVANTSLRTGKDEQRAATLELRVPSDRFDGLLSALGNLGKVESVTATAEDVAEEYVDLGARAANARRVEARLVEMLATRTGKLSDVLTVEQELARVRMEAERYDARLRWLERRATLSSLDVTIHEAIPLIDNTRNPGPLAEAFAEAWNRTIAVVAWCIASLGLLIPLGVLIGLAVAIARRLLRGGTPPGMSQA